MFWLVLSLLLVTATGKPTNTEQIAPKYNAFDKHDKGVSKRQANGIASFQTYNIAGAGYMAEYEKRRAMFGNFASQLTADCVCLQECFFLSDMQTILEAAPDYTYSYSFRHSPQSGQLESPNAPCPIQVVMTVGVCYFLLCQKSQQLTVCLRDKCHLYDKPQECITCLVNSVGNIADALACSKASKSTNPVGLMILSKLELTNLQANRFQPHQNQVWPRGHIDAEISGIGRISCTHLTATIDGPYFGPPGFDNYKDAIESEARDLTNANPDFSVIVGDLNSGDENLAANIDALQPTALGIFLNDGFVSPVKSLNQCTLCRSNPVSGDTNSAIDHILIRSDMTTSNPEVACKEHLSGHDFPLSDHYCVKLDIGLAGGTAATAGGSEESEDD